MCTWEPSDDRGGEGPLSQGWSRDGVGGDPYGGQKVYEAPRVQGILLLSSLPCVPILCPSGLVSQRFHGDGVVSRHFPGDGAGDANGGAPAAAAGGADER